MNQPQRRTHRIRYELKHRPVHVVRIEPQGSQFIRIVFGGEALYDFCSRGFDDHIKFIFQDVDSGETLMRDYTPRHFDPERQELSIEFALHGEGSACRWAQQARPGQTATIAGPRGSLLIAGDYDWYLLAGDATALPAIRRCVEELPTNSRIRVMLQMPEDYSADEWQAHPHIDLHLQHTDSALLEQLQTLPLPEGIGFVWAAGEKNSMAQIRKLIRQQTPFLSPNTRIAAYWRKGCPCFHEELQE